MNAARTIDVLLADDHPVVREGLMTVLAPFTSIRIIGEAGSTDAALQKAVQLNPDVVLMDVKMPGTAITKVIGRIRNELPDTQILMLSGTAESEQVADTLAAGATGYLLKDVLAQDLVDALRMAAQGEEVLAGSVRENMVTNRAQPARRNLSSLTPREKSVLKLLAGGRSNKVIASELNLTEGTVKGYVSTILDKLQVSDRTQAAILAVRHGMGEDRAL